MPAKPKKAKGKKGGGGGGDAKLRKYVEQDLYKWLDEMHTNILSIRNFICDIEARVYYPGSPEAIAAQPHCNRPGGTIDGNGTPPPPPKFT
jgi:hypothetical protein